MSWRPLLCYFLTVWALTFANNQRSTHRLIGGHLKIFHEDAQDTELLSASASGSKDKNAQKTTDDKTLSQQVADGKYGLIQKELFAKPSKRPGVLSYDPNPDVPNDNIANLGGLTKNDIWLAENHLLVLKGGTYPPHDDNKDDKLAWPAIDDYKAPLRPVKLPLHPKVPPPFPVQLTDDGPLQILGTNSTRTLNGTFDKNALFVPPEEGGFEPGEGPFYPPFYQYPANATAGQAPFPIPAFPSGEYQPGAPFPPYTLNGTLPPYFASLPPGAAVLPPPPQPPQNQTEIYDEDDPSIYYPPPYSFYYQTDNSSKVPPGPLVPGIILPPPPNFFRPLEDATEKQRKQQHHHQRKPHNRHRTKTTTPHPSLLPTTTPQPPTAIVINKSKKPPPSPHRIPIPSEINNELNSIITTTTLPPPVVTILPIRPKPRPTRPPTVTILKPVKTTQKPPQIYVYNNNVNRKPFDVYGPPQSQRVKTIVSTTQVPLKIYYSTSEIETNSISQTTRAPKQQYYFYEDRNKGQAPKQEPKIEVTTKKPNYFDIPNEYYVPAKPATPPPPQQYYYVNNNNNNNRPYNTQRSRYRFVQQPPKADSFSIHIARLQKQIQQYYTTPRPVYHRPVHSPKPVYQFSFQAANYHRPIEQEQDKFRPLPKYSVQIQPAIEIVQPTQKPEPLYYRQEIGQSSSEKSNYDYDESDESKSGRPISQYSFEATPSPVYQGYYTKSDDESGYDENTKQYFTTFGQKIPSGTTPLPQIIRAPSNVHKNQKPISLHGDTRVNYLQPRPAINPDVEFLPNFANSNGNNYQDYDQQKSVENKPGSEENSNGPGSFISYELPGDDGAHFYFLTPQLAQRTDQGAGYYYEQPPENAPRIRRKNER